MKHEYIEAYEFYKRQYPGNVILFHIGAGYYAFEDDSFVVADIDGYSISYSREDDYHWYDFYQDELEEMLLTMRKVEISVTVVEHRDSDGSFNVPKVKQILQDIEDDY